MSVVLLVGIAMAQGVFLVLLLALVIGGRWLGVYRVRRLEEHEQLAASTVLGWLAGACSDQECREAIDELDYRSVSAFLLDFSEQRGGSEWEHVADVLRPTEWFARLCEESHSHLWWRRLAAARLLSCLAMEDDAALVWTLLGDKQTAVRVEAATIVSRIPTRELAKRVFEIASSSTAIVRGHLLQLLARNRGLLEPILVDLLDEESDTMHLRMALDLSGQIAVPHLHERVLSHASSESLEVRIAATRALRSFPHPSTSQVLLELLGDWRWEVRTQAAISLGAIGAVEACDALGNALQDLNWWVRLRSALALRVLGPKGQEVLEATDAEKDRYAYEMARYVLGLADSALAEFSTDMGLAVKRGTSVKAA
jgi:HEAT repeat protein